MSLQVSNQNPSGRRTPQVYQGFGGVVAPSVTTTPTATNGGGSAQPNAAGSGSIGRPAKGNNKQSQIPVAIGGTMVGTPNIETAVPQMAAGNTDTTPNAGKKQFQPDHVYGMKHQGAPSLMVVTAPLAAAAGTNRSTTNGSQQPAAGNEKLRKNSTGVGGDGMAGKKAEPTQLPVLTEGGAAKGRTSTNARTQQKQLSDEVATVGKGSEQQPKSSDKAAVFENSLLTERPLKGFCSDGEEMDSLLEPWDLDESQKQTQTQSSAKSKQQKPASQAQEHVSPSKAGGKSQSKLETVAAEKEVTATPNKKAQQADGEGEQSRSPKAGGPKVAQADVPSTPTNVGDGSDSLIGRPLRSISGRRSTRHIGDIKFTHQRRSNANDSVSSMNVTIGSEIGNDSLMMRTPGSASRKRKDMTPESTSGDGPVAESPKRARLDFSGFLGMVATPVTMLKNRLSRVKLHSTPRALAVDEEDASKVVTAEATTTTTSSSNTSTQKEAGETNDNGAKPDGMEVDVAGTKEEADEKPASEKKDIEVGQEEGSTVDDEVEVKIVTDQQPQKQWCSIM